MPKIWERIFYFITYCSQGTSFISVWAYGILHRMHHAYSDTEKDPHSPKFFKTVFGMMWQTRKVYSSILRGKLVSEERFTQDLPNNPAIERIGDSWFSRIGWTITYALVYFLILPAGWW